MNAADQTMRMMRARVREADAISHVNKRAYGIFRHMVEKATEMNRQAEIDFTLTDLRTDSQAVCGKPCKWCGRPITAKNFSWDHYKPIARHGTFSRANLECICSVCNGQKGQLTGTEFGALRIFLKALAKEAQADILRRLGLGARWRS